MNDGDVAAIALPPMGAVWEISSSNDNSQAQENEVKNKIKLVHGEDASTDKYYLNKELEEIPAVKSVPPGE